MLLDGIEAWFENVVPQRDLEVTDADVVTDLGAGYLPLNAAATA